MQVTKGNPRADAGAPETMPFAYGAVPADEFLRFIGPLPKTIVDVGSGEGAWAPLLRQAGAKRLVAIEPDPSAARSASTRYDLVIERSVEDVDREVIQTADLLILADCLEHTLDPWNVLRRLWTSARPASALALSVPNFRYLGILLPALLRGQFAYSDHGGVMDRGHLRWFTRRSLHDSLVSAGWVPTRWSGTCGDGRRELLDRLTMHRLSDLLCHQLYVLASRSTEEPI